MMGSRRTNEKDGPPTSANPSLQTNSIAPNIQSAHSLTFQEGNVSTDQFDSIPYSPLLNAHNWENMYSMNQSITQGIPETSGIPISNFMNPSSFQNPQINLNSNTANTYLPEVPLLPELNMRWSPQYINQGHNAISTSKNPTTARNFSEDLLMNRQVGELKFVHSNPPQVKEDIDSSPLHYYTPIHTRNNVNLNTSQCGVQGKVEGSFLSLGIGGTEEAMSSSQKSTREISNQLKEAASAELKLARARKAMGQNLNANFTGFQRNTCFSNQLGHVDRLTSTNNGVHYTPNSGPSSYHNPEMQQGNMQHGYLNQHRAIVGNQAVQSGTLGGNSAQFLNSQQYGFNRVAPDTANPSWAFSQTPSGQLQNIRFKTSNTLQSESSVTSPSLGLGSSTTRQNYGGNQVKHHMPTQGPVGGLFPQRTTVPQVSWVNSGQPATDLPFPKRLGVEFNGRDGPQAAERHLTPRGTSLQTTNTGQMYKVPDRVSTQMPNNVVQHSIARTDGANVNCTLNSQAPFYTHGQSQNALGQLNPQGTTSTTASTVGGYVRPYYKRSAVAPPPSPHWVQRQKMTHHPNIHQTPTFHQHSMPIRLPTRPPIPVTTPPLIHPPIPLTQSHTQRAPVNPSIPNFRPRVPVTTPPPPPAVYHITRKDPDETPPLTKYKCLLCKRDLSLTSEGAVYQPTPPPPVAVLPCGHTFHDQCLQKITPQDQAKDPPCIPCAIGEN